LTIIFSKSQLTRNIIEKWRTVTTQKNGATPKSQMSRE